MMSDEKRTELQAISDSIWKKVISETRHGRVRHVYNLNTNRTKKNQPLLQDTCYDCGLKNPKTKYCKGRPKKAEG